MSEAQPVPIEKYEWLYGEERPEWLQGEIGDMRENPRIDISVMDIPKSEKDFLRASRETANAALIEKYGYKDTDIADGDQPVEARHFDVRQAVREKTQEPPDDTDIILDGIGTVAALALARATDTKGREVQQKLGLPPEIIPLATEESHALVAHEIGAAMPGKSHMDKYSLEILEDSKLSKDTHKRSEDPVPTLAGSKVKALIELKEDESLLPDIDRIDPEVLDFMKECLRAVYRTDHDPNVQAKAATTLHLVEQREIAQARVLTAA